MSTTHLYLALVALAWTLCDAQYMTAPRRLYSKPGGAVTILGRHRDPLANCEFYFFPANAKIDLSYGPDSPSNDVYEYFGAGLEQGECGIKLKNVQEANDGIVESKVKSVSSAEWERSATTLRVTTLDQSRLPTFSINPQRAALAVGDNLTVTCNTDRPITMCHIYLPGGFFLNFDQGAASASSPLARYHGTGLAQGQCGVQLSRARDKLTGYIVCKVGDWPDGTPGPWETEALHITTTATRPAPTIPSPPGGPGPGTQVTGTKCPPVIAPNLALECRHGGKLVACNKPMDVGTEVHMECSSNVNLASEFTSYTSIRCTSALTWDKPVISCTPDCGRRNKGGRPFAWNGALSGEGEFPWHMAVYQKNGGKYLLECGGSLITPSLVVSAAHCFWDAAHSRKQNIAQYRIAGGKLQTSWLMGKEKVQRRNISELHIHDRFDGDRQNYAQDIAIVKVSKEFKLTWSINVICIDWRGETDTYFREGSVGIVPGWGFNENNTQSVELHHVELPYVPYETCRLQVPVDFRRYLTADKFCGGYVNRAVSVCPGDSGGGFVFPVSNPRGERYYLRGIVSVGTRPLQTNCDPNQLAAFTTVGDFRTWMAGFVFGQTTQRSRRTKYTFTEDLLRI